MNDPEKIQTLIGLFCEGAVKFRDSTDPVVANQFFDQYLSALRLIISMGPGGVSTLAVLLDDPRPVLRVRAALDLISYYPEKVIPILQKELSKKSPYYPEALVTLERWKRGAYLDPRTGKEKRIEKRAS